MSRDTKLTFEIIPFDEWAHGIAPLWNMQGAACSIPQVLHGHGQLRYQGQEAYERIILFPLAASLQRNRIGWTSIYNISDDSLRIRGIYVLPTHRALGVGSNLVRYALSLWPPEYKRAFMYARESNVERYERWGFTCCSEFRARSFEKGESFGDKRVVLMHKVLDGGIGGST